MTGYLTVAAFRLALVGDIDVTFHITIVTDPEVSSSGYVLSSDPLLD